MEKQTAVVVSRLQISQLNHHPVLAALELAWRKCKQEREEVLYKTILSMKADISSKRMNLPCTKGLTGQGL